MSSNRVKNQYHYTAVSVQLEAPEDPVLKTEPKVVISKQAVLPVSDHFLTLSVVLTVVCFLMGTWYSLLCTIPAIVFAVMARNAEAHGNLNDAQNKAQFSLLLNIVALVWWIIAFVILVLSIAIVVTGAASQGSSCKLDQNYNYYDCS